MSAKVRHSFYRHPRTTQEIKANLDCEYVRAKRKNIPNAYYDIRIHWNSKKSWKKSRKTQYREETKDYSWFFYYETQYAYRANKYRVLIPRIERIGFYYEWVRNSDGQCGIKWFGKDIS